MKFNARGHPNITATHKTTLEFTKDDHVTPAGDCIIGVSADFDPQELSRFAKEHDKARITISAAGHSDTLTATCNPTFNDPQELVIRLGEHASERTFATRADKAAKHLSKEMIDSIKHGATIEVTIEAAE